MMEIMEILANYITVFFNTTLGIILLIIFGVMTLAFGIVMATNPRESGEERERYE